THREVARTPAHLLDRGLKVIALAADFRRRDAAAHTSWYGQDPVPGLRARAVYGLPERHRAEIAKADLVAVPGCYPTATVLAIAPLLPLVGAPLIVDAHSGVSGAGRTPSLTTHFPEIAEGIRPYKAARTHRHTPEIEQEPRAPPT